MIHWEQEERAVRPRREPKALRIRRTRLGKGLFAGRNYPVSAVIGEITGEVIYDENYGSDFCFDIGDGRHLEPNAPFRFVNHNCEPNCEFDYFQCSDEQGEEPRTRAYLIALRDIHAGEELTIDYNWTATNAIPCRCQAPSCRGWVVSEELIDALVDE